MTDCELHFVYVFVFDGEQLLRRAIVFSIEKDKECSPVENAGRET